MTIEVEIQKSKYDVSHLPHINVYDNEYLTNRAKICLDMITKWGIIAGDNDGEDSAGRSRLKLQDPKELVDRAISITEYAFNRFKENGFIYESMTLKEAKKIVKEKNTKNEN